MKYIIYSIFILCSYLGMVTISFSDSHYMPMPPKFGINSEPEKVLLDYPLGVINQQAAFSHHGKSHKDLELPNKNVGWLYDVGQSAYHRTYILVFDKQGIVVDVLYYDHSRYSTYGISALLMQSVNVRTSAPTLGYK